MQLAKTYLDQLVDYPAQIMAKISEDKYCVGLIRNKSFSEICDEDKDYVLENHIFDYQYVDENTEEATAYIWVEVEIPSVENSQVKGVSVYVTIACHKEFMKLNKDKHILLGNRRDNLVRYVDRILNNYFAEKDEKHIGIGKLTLKSVRTLTPINRFAMRELTYRIPDFNIVKVTE